jgi:hypothetical protein
MGMLISPAVRLRPDPPVLFGPPEACAGCGAYISVYCRISAINNQWECVFCKKTNLAAGPDRLSSVRTQVVEFLGDVLSSASMMDEVADVETGIAAAAVGEVAVARSPAASATHRTDGVGLVGVPCSPVEPANFIFVVDTNLSVQLLHVSGGAQGMHF